MSHTLMFVSRVLFSCYTFSLVHCNLSHWKTSLTILPLPLPLPYRMSLSKEIDDLGGERVLDTGWEKEIFVFSFKSLAVGTFLYPFLTAKCKGYRIRGSNHVSSSLWSIMTLEQKAQCVVLVGREGWRWRRRMNKKLRWTFFALFIDIDNEEQVLILSLVCPVFSLFSCLLFRV